MSGEWGGRRVRGMDLQGMCVFVRQGERKSLCVCKSKRGG